MPILIECCLFRRMLMIKVLVIESLSTDFLQIKQLLSQASTENYEFQCVDSFDLKKVLKVSCDILVLPQSKYPNKTLSLLQQIISTNPNYPVIYLTNTVDQKLSHECIRKGADDCLPKSELSSLLFDRSIRHAILKKQEKREVSHLTTHDRLTGLANRYLLYEHMEHSINLAKRNKNRFAVLLIDLDKFKLINDSLGHDIGDILLVQVAERLLSCVRETDIVARFGNDEFTILLENSGTGHNTAAIAEKIQNAMEQLFEVQGHELFITASIGIATFPENGTEPQTLLKSADSALYKAKELGRNKYYFFTNDLNRQTQLKFELEKNLRRALINGEFSVFLQPQVCTYSHKIAGAEALLRWNHPKYGMVSPTVFIPLLDELGMLVGVEGWVLNQVCHLAKKFITQYGDIKFSVNISGSHFKSQKLKENIYLALQSSLLDAKNLEVELTEDIMIENIESNNQLLDELKELGLSIALDDFGKGYSSLSYLKNFPANILKIDKSFIDNLVNDRRDSAIVEAMINLSHKLNIEVIAEGVEDKKQLAQLQRFGCDYIQGYYFAKAMSIQAFEQHLKKSTQKKQCLPKPKQNYQQPINQYQ